VKAVAEPFYLLSVELTLLFQNQGHNTLAAQILCKILLSKSIRIHQFLQHFDARNLFDGEMLRFVVRDQNDEQFGRFRLFRSSMCFALQFQKPGNIGLVLLSRRNGLRSLECERERRQQEGEGNPDRIYLRVATAEDIRRQRGLPPRSVILPWTRLDDDRDMVRLKALASSQQSAQSTPDNSTQSPLSGEGSAQA
jgi:hypothetical protein